MSATSETHPLRIDAVTLPGGGRIGMTFCPGKVQRDAMSGAWNRDLGIDLAAIRDWGASTLITLMERPELGWYQVPDLGRRAEEIGLEWHHLPIKDVNAPDGRFEPLWTYSGHRLRQLLRQSESIVLHCKGGLGRTGTIAARLLVELGVTPDDAIQAVREARPGAIETSTQEAYVQACKPVPEDETALGRVLGCLLGGAVGDAFGYEVEFDRLPAIRDRFGPMGIEEPVFHAEKLVVSDDTQMTLFTLEGLLRARNDDGCPDPTRAVHEIRRAYLDWLATQGRQIQSWEPAGCLHVEEVLIANRDPGNTCLAALRTGGQGTIENHINDSKGCGGVMRVAPIGLVTAWSPEEVFEVAARAAALTHGHPTGYWSAGAMALMVRLMMDSEGLLEAARAALEALVGRPGSDETMDTLRAALGAAEGATADHTEVVSVLGEGWVAEEALAVGLYAAVVGRSYPEAVQIAANHDGDSDSTASVAGQLYGAENGLMPVPNAWAKGLDVFEPAMVLTESLCSHLS